LDSEEGRHDAKDSAALIVDGMDADDMDGCRGGESTTGKRKKKSGRTRGSCEEEGGTDRFEEVEFLARL